MSYLYEQGLRPPRCNGCRRAKLRYELGEKFLQLPSGIYELDAEPRPGQGEPQEHKGRPISFRFWGMSYEHSDECYGWTPPEEDETDEDPATQRPFRLSDAGMGQRDIW